MNARLVSVGMLAMGMLAASAQAQSRIVTVNPGGGWTISNDGTRAYGGASRFEISGGALTVSTLPGTSPNVTAASDDGAFAAGLVSSAAARYDRSTGMWTTLPFAAPITALNNVRDISATGQFMVGQCSATGGFSGWVWDASTNMTRRLLGNTTTARAMAVSADGAVIVGGESPNVAGTTSGGRAGVWRYNVGTMNYDWSYLPDGPVDAMGGTVYRTVDQFQISDDGNIIVGTSFQYDSGDMQVHNWITRWVWNAGTSQWDRFNLYDMNSQVSISSWWSNPDCPVPPRFFISGMTDDGNTIIGQLEYSLCGSFYRAGFIYVNNNMEDLYDYLSEQGVNLDAAGYGPFPFLGLMGVHLGQPLDISDDGMHISGQPVLDPDAPGGWVISLNAGGSCVPAVAASNPAASTQFSACTSSVILSASGAGTPPFTFEWRKDGGAVIVPGPTGNGSTYQIVANGAQLRINAPLSQADAGMYTCTVVNSCGMATSTAAAVTVDPAFATGAVNDTCGTATTVVMGTNVLGAGESPCSAWVDDPSVPSCLSAQERTDRWYSFTPGIGGEYRFETCGANFDTVISVYDGCGGLELACNNDRDSGSATGCSSQRSRIDRLSLSGGSTYLVRIGAPLSAFLSNTNLINLSIIPAPARAANDDCANATAAVIGANALDTTEATADGSGSCSPPGLFRDVWFRFTPTAPGYLRASTCPGTTWNTVLTIFDGCFGNELGCNDNANVSGCFNQSIVDNVRVTPSGTYVIRVGGNSSTAFGTGTLTLSFICLADYNRDGAVTSQDFFDFIVAFFNGDVAADINGDLAVNSQDFFDFITLFFSGC
ncbi:MAG: GC-type dockerin domain-anchored protein [Phycisphaerales bacterium]